jgi:hypothetical protein
MTDLIAGGLGLVIGAIIGATIGYKWISAELATAKADLSSLLDKAAPIVTAAGPLTPTAALAAAVSAVKTKVAK